MADQTEESQTLHINEISMICWMCGVTLRDSNSCEELRAQVGIKSIVAEMMRRRRLWWYGHIERGDDSWLNKVLVDVVVHCKYLGTCDYKRPMHKRT